jgi:hypothetical protein
MTAQSSANSIFFRPASAAIVAHVGLGVGIGLGWLAGPMLAEFAPGEVVRSALLAGAAWLIGIWLGLAVMVLVSRRKAMELGLAVMASSVTRLLSALFLGLLIFLGAGPDGRSFWILFLTAGLGVLIAESLWAVKTLNRASEASASGVGA